jgi:hypothetical protein
MRWACTSLSIGDVHNIVNSDLRIDLYLNGASGGIQDIYAKYLDELQLGHGFLMQRHKTVLFFDVNEAKYHLNGEVENSIPGVNRLLLARSLGSRRVASVRGYSTTNWSSWEINNSRWR